MPPFARPNPARSEIYARKRSVSSGLGFTLLAHGMLILLFINLPKTVIQMEAAELKPINMTLQLAAPPPEPLAEPLPEPEPPVEPEPLPVPVPIPEPVQVQPKEAPPKQIKRKTAPKPAKKVEPAPVAEPTPQAVEPQPAQQAPARPDATTLQQLMASLQREVEAKKYYPSTAQRAGKEGTARVLVVIGKDGRIESVRPLGATHEILGKASIVTMEKVRKSWTFANWSGGRVEIEVPIVYKLD